MSSASVSLMEVGHSFSRGPSLLSKYLNKPCLNRTVLSALWPLNNSSEEAFYWVFCLPLIVKVQNCTNF